MDDRPFDDDRHADPQTPPLAPPPVGTPDENGNVDDDDPDL